MIFFKKHKELILIILLLFVASFFRFYNLNWDHGNYFHPDERNIANAVTKIVFFKELNPGFFAYGGFSIYLYRFAADNLTFITKDINWITNWGNIDLIGRFFSAFFSVITIIPVFYLAKKLFNEKIAAVSAFIYTFCVTSIQEAHFAVTESLFTLTGVLIAIFSIKIFENPKLKNYLKTGILLGIGLATKTTEVLFFIFPISSLFLLFRNKKSLKQMLYFIILGFFSLIVFFIFSPFTFLDWKDFYASMNYESGVAIGTLPVVYTYQFNETIPYVFQAINFFWQLGPVAIFSIVGFLILIIKTIKDRNSKLIIFLSFPIIYFLYVGSWHTKFIRYMVPLMPFLIIYASFLLVRIYEIRPKIGLILITIFLGLTVLWAFAFFSIYTRPQTRLVASRWIYSHIPNGSKIYTEAWDDGLPIPIGINNPTKYQTTALNIYDPDNQIKLDYYSTELSSGQYIVINSRRLYGTLIRLTKMYPLTSKYYKDLFSGKLGYKKVAQFSSYPSIFGIQINDDSSEETFQVYDHPKVMIFKNTKNYSFNKIKNILEN